MGEEEPLRRAACFAAQTPTVNPHHICEVSCRAGGTFRLRMPAARVAPGYDRGTAAGGHSVARMAGRRGVEQSGSSSGS